MELQKRIPTMGRIRIGDRIPIAKGDHKGKPRPRQLDNFRLTSKNKLILEHAARIYGGEPKQWKVPEAWTGHRPEDDDFELYTTSNTLNVLIPAKQAVQTTCEIWKAGKCTRRCDPGTEKITHSSDPSLLNKDCICPPDPVERHEKSRRGEACMEVTRIHLFLKDVPGFGIWRLDTMGFYGPAEIRGVLEFLEMAGVREMIPASLRIEKRKIKTDNGTREFVVPTLTSLLTPAELISQGTQQSVRLLTEQSLQVPEVTAEEITGAGNGMHRKQSKIQQVKEMCKALGITPEMFSAWLRKRGYELLADAPEAFLDSVIDGLDKAGVDMVTEAVA